MTHLQAVGRRREKHGAQRLPHPTRPPSLRVLREGAALTMWEFLAPKMSL